MHEMNEIFPIAKKISPIFECVGEKNIIHMREKCPIHIFIMRTSYCACFSCRSLNFSLSPLFLLLPLYDSTLNFPFFPCVYISSSTFSAQWMRVCMLNIICCLVNLENILRGFPLCFYRTSVGQSLVTLLIKLLVIKTFSNDACWYF